MKYNIDKNAGEPAYLQLYRQIREDIVGGVYSPLSKLPSKRTLAEDTGVSIITAAHAYELLCDEGYVESRERSGYIVIFRASDVFTPPEKRVNHLFPASAHSDTKTEFPFSVLAKAMRTVISNMGESILDRSPNIGTEELRNTIVAYLKRNRGIAADPEQIVIGSGSEYLYDLIVGLLGRDKRFAIEAPSYKMIEQVYRATGVAIDKLPLGSDGIDSTQLKNCLADVLHISPYRSYPSGITASASKRHEYLQWASDGRIIIEDDFESEFSVSRKAEETLFSHTVHDNVIYMNTFSMTVSPSLRVGYMILPKHLVGVFQEKLGFYSCTVPTYIQYVLAELISSGDFERHINRVRRAKRRELSK